MIREIPDMLKKILKEMENQLKISQEKGWWKRKDKKSSIFEPRSSVIEEFVSLSLNSSIGKLFGQLQAVIGASLRCRSVTNSPRTLSGQR